MATQTSNKVSRLESLLVRLESAFTWVTQSIEDLEKHEMGIRADRREREKKRLVEVMDRLDCTIQHLKDHPRETNQESTKES